MKRTMLATVVSLAAVAPFFACNSGVEYPTDPLPFHDDPGSAGTSNPPRQVATAPTSDPAPNSSPQVGTAFVSAGNASAFGDLGNGNGDGQGNGKDSGTTQQQTPNAGAGTSTFDGG